MRAVHLRVVWSITVLAMVLAAPVLRAAEKPILRLATTTSTENSGLLREILPTFEAETGYRVHVIAVGTGRALRMGRDGDVDIVLVHARADEEKFVAAGYGVERRDVMYNDFVILGPASDPAGIVGMADASLALARIAERGAPFISRGDESGTHRKEQALWQTAGQQPKGRWYHSIGQGMEQALQMADELQAYVLTDRGTWQFLRKRLDLSVLVQGDTRLFNPYGVIAVNPARFPDANYRGALAFIEWLTSRAGQDRISAYQVNGNSLFFPMAQQARQAPP
ncbi:MAG: substrate-binding domain-containing protein [Pseudomonadota bacterium]|nr:MAG: substrate-binding domain-containing protein [Pseudomonadota bacterium]